LVWISSDKRPGEQAAANSRDFRDQQSQNVLTTVRHDKVGRAPILTPTRQREADEDQHTQGAVTVLIDVDPVVFESPRDLFARWYEIEYHGMAAVWRRNVGIMPHFRHVKVYYNYVLARRKCQEVPGSVTSHTH
jgi:hypothetical protein